MVQSDRGVKLTVHFSPYQVEECMELDLLYVFMAWRLSVTLGQRVSINFKYVPTEHDSDLSTVYCFTKL
jgi:hypothetical protein